MSSVMRQCVKDQSVGDTVYYLQCRVHLSPSPAPHASGSQCPCSETQQVERKRVRKQTTTELSAETRLEQTESIMLTLYLW